MQVTPEMIVSIGALAASVITSFVVVRTRVQQMEEELKEAIKSLSTLDSRVDKNDNKTDLVDQKVKVLSAMMDPDAREKLHRELERHQVEMEHLRKDVDSHRGEYQKAHNGRHPPVDNSYGGARG